MTMSRGKTVTMVVQLDDEPGLLSIVLKTIAEYHANILTIHQSIPVNGIASLTLTCGCTAGDGGCRYDGG